MALHDPEYLWTDCYLLFENIMNLGVKELYYKEDATTPKASEEETKEVKEYSSTRSS